MGSSKFLLKFHWIAIFQKMGDSISFVNDMNLSYCIFFHEMLDEAITKLENTRGSNNVNCMHLILIVSLQKADGHFDGFYHIKGTSQTQIDYSDPVFNLAVNEHVSVQKLKKILQTVEKLLFFKLYVVDLSHIKNNNRSVLSIPTVEIKDALFQNMFN